MLRFLHKERGIKGVSRKLRPRKKLRSQTSDPENSDSSKKRLLIYIANSSQFLSPDILWSRNVHRQQPERSRRDIHVKSPPVYPIRCHVDQTASEKLTRFKIAADTLMTFAGDFFTEEIERQSRYKVRLRAVSLLLENP